MDTPTRGAIVSKINRSRESPRIVQGAERPTRAAQYLRMSKGHQTGSLQNQAAAIRTYADLHGFDIIRTYCDEGKSGLDLAHRPGLRQLLDDVLTQKADFNVALVHDVSRWGRFQDPDESAHYEFLCRLAGVQVHYCAECFARDESSTASLMKSLKRLAAAEYAREMSKRVFTGQCGAARNGYSTGGPAGYGLRRLLVDSDGNSKMLLARGEQKSIAADRVRYIAGPGHEIQVVREIYSMFLDKNLNYTAIARRLNERRITREECRCWDNFAIRRILTHPKYRGCCVFNRTSQKLRSNKTRNPPEQWIVEPNSIEPIVSAEQFQRVQDKIKRRVANRSDEELLNGLRELRQTHGRISVKLITDTEGLASWVTYRNRFGSIGKAYEAIGYTGSLGYVRGARCRRWCAQLRDQIQRELMQIVQGFGRRVIRMKRGIKIEGVGRLRVGVATVKEINGRTVRWAMRMEDLRRDLMFVARIGEDYETTLDFLCLLPPPNQVTFSFSEQRAQKAFLGRTVADAVRALLKKPDCVSGQRW